MNPFFEPTGDYYAEAPQTAYARFDQAEPVDAVGAKERLVAYSGVSADLFEEQGDYMFRLDAPGKMIAFWKKYWTDLFGISRGARPPEDVFSRVPLFRYEISINSDQADSFEQYSNLTNEAEWLRIEQDPKSDTVADVYSNAFGVAQEVRVKTTRVVDKETSQALTAMFDMTSWRDASISEITNALNDVGQQAEYFAAYDVGQGAATALLKGDQTPFLYYDLGAGIYQNAHTTSLPLEFCWTNEPVIILSHWDMDHWAGATKDTEAKKRTWIVPRQTLKPKHTAFANEILNDGGKILVWPTGTQPQSVSLGRNQTLTLGSAQGKTLTDRGWQFASMMTMPVKLDTGWGREMLDTTSFRSESPEE